MTDISKERYGYSIAAIGTTVFERDKPNDHVAHLTIPMWAAQDPDDSHGVRAKVHARTKLFAAAPSLLEALEKIAEPIDTKTCIGDPWGFYADLQAIARAAISSARGEA